MVTVIFFELIICPQAIVLSFSQGEGWLLAYWIEVLRVLLQLKLDAFRDLYFFPAQIQLSR